ncbi:MAG: hypothetical protein AAF702_39980 [Chloroflexota bacterium]
MTNTGSPSVAAQTALTQSANQSTNAYVGPRTFRREDGGKFYGREYEASELLARVISQRLTLFYAQSGAGKSSIVNARLVPQLQEQGFSVLPVGRVSGELPQGIDGVDNIFLYNLMLSLDSSEMLNPQDLANLSLPQFLAQLVSNDGEHFYFDPSIALHPDGPIDGSAGTHQEVAEKTGLNGSHKNSPLEMAEIMANLHEEADDELAPYVLIIDQFEEIITTHLDRWDERDEFFRQLNQAMRVDPNLWVLLTLREDYVASLDPYAPLLDGKLRDRFYMERMAIEGALQAVAQPAADAGRPFAEGVAKELVDQLRLVRVHGSDEPQLGQYVEPVQLQVVCYQLWEKVKDQPGNTIQSNDLPVGYIEQALRLFYSDVLQKTLNQQADLPERILRDWFTHELITEAHTRGTVYRDENTGTTAGLPNAVVDLIAQHFLLRTELRAGGAWIELVHDRFVDPILQDNAEWFANYDNPLVAPTKAWLKDGRTSDKLLTDSLLAQAQTYAAQNESELTESEREFLDESTREQKRREEEARRKAQLQLIVLATASVLAVVFASLAYWGVTNMWRAEREEAAALAAQATAVAEAKRADNEADNARIAQGLAEENEEQARIAEAEAKEQARIALSRQLAAQAWNEWSAGNPDFGLLLGIEGLNAQDTLEAISGLRRIVAQPDGTIYQLSGHQRGIHRALWSWHKDRILTVANGGEIFIWDASTGERVLEFVGHDSVIWHTQWSQDDNYILTTSRDGTARVWDSTSGDLRLTMDGHDQFVTYGTWDAAETRIATASTDATARIWDVATGEELLVLEGHQAPLAQAHWNADGSRLLTTSFDGTARIWNTETGEVIVELTGHTDIVWSGAWNRDETHMLTTSYDGTARVWDATTGEVLLMLHGHTDAVQVGRWNHDETLIFTASNDGTARVWDANTGEAKLVLKGHTDQINAGGWNADESLLLTSGWDNTARIWDATTGDELLVLKGHTSKLNFATWHPTENLVMTASGDKTARVWDIVLAERPRGELPLLFGHAGTVNEAHWSDSGDTILTASADGVVRLWAASSAQLLLDLAVEGDQANTAIFAPDEMHIAVGYESGRIIVWSAMDNEERISFDGHDKRVTQLIWANDGNRLLSAGSDMTTRLWDIQTGDEVLNLQGHTAAVTGIRWHQDANRILTSSEDSSARIWDAATGAEIRLLDGHERRVTVATWSHNYENILTAGNDGTVKIWDTATGETLSTLTGHSNWIMQATWSQDDQRILTASTDRTARVWHVESGEETLLLKGHTDALTSAQWLADETRILTASEDGTARIWDATSGQQLSILAGHTAQVNMATWHPDGTKVLTASADGTARQFYSSIKPLLSVACTMPWRNMTQDEWTQVFGQQDYQITCSNLPSGVVEQNE